MYLIINFACSNTHLTHTQEISGVCIISSFCLIFIFLYREELKMGSNPRCFMCRKPTSASALSPISSSFRSRLKMNLFKELVFSPAFIERLNASASLESQMSDSSCRFWGQGEETDICSGCSVTLEEAWNWTKELTAIQLRVEESVRRTRESVGRNVLKQEDSISGIIIKR
jgi:predicted Fe-S protein YdhL (DUF1289 family)